MKALLELGAVDVNYPVGPFRKTPLHIAAEIVSPDMAAILLDHHADPNVQTVYGVTPLDVLRTLASDFLLKGAAPGLTLIEPNKLRRCLELVHSATFVLSLKEGAKLLFTNLYFVSFYFVLNLIVIIFNLVYSVFIVEFDCKSCVL